MWSITPEGVGQVKEELKGRRAAIQARYDDEVQKLDAELNDIEAFERVATAFAQRHNQGEASVSVEPGPIAPLEALPTATELATEVEETDHLDHLRTEDHGGLEILSAGEALPVAINDTDKRKVSSRWRLRV
jgi:hypothetical protein